MAAFRSSPSAPKARRTAEPVRSLMPLDPVRRRSWSRLAIWNESNTGAQASCSSMNEPIHAVRCRSPSASGVTGSSRSARATISRPSSAASTQNTSSFDEKYW
jgi:hypothetical protein